MLGLALILAVTGAILLIFGASQQAECSPAGMGGCTSINYTPVYLGIVILVAAIAIAVASTKSKPVLTNHGPTPAAVTE
jgi:hypothetical protein